ncbi:MAG: DUF1566 domain-containing protein [Hylemonella sp.]|uniref:DUF1566 domain-containing protein n=1 Tax=Hylemonella sp. TaxID=2066020 RepID=UPI00391C8F33
MPPITIEAIEARQSELDKMIQQFKAQSSVRVIEIEGRTIELQPGERYAGARLDEQGQHLHDVIVLAARPDSDKNWQAAQDWAADQGGEAPTPEEFALIKANCPEVLSKSWYWTNKTHAQDASCAWYFTSDGFTLSHHKSAAGGALAVRRF